MTGDRYVFKFLWRGLERGLDTFDAFSNSSGVVWTRPDVVCYSLGKLTWSVAPDLHDYGDHNDKKNMRTTTATEFENKILEFRAKNSVNSRV